METNHNADELLFDMLFGAEGKSPNENPAGIATVPGSTSRLSASEARSVENALSSLQERLWLVQQMDPSSTAYVIPSHMILRGKLDTAALKNAIQAVWNRHDALRTIFPTVDGLPTRAFLPSDALVIPEYNFLGLEKTGDWKEHYYKSHLQDFCLEKGPLFRTCIYKFSETDHALLIDLHHINADGVSMEIIRSEIFGSYFARIEGRVPELAPLSASYDDFVRDETARRRTPGYDRDMKACLATLKDAPTRIDADVLGDDRPKSTGRTGFEIMDDRLPGRPVRLGKMSGHRRNDHAVTEDNLTYPQRTEEMRECRCHI